MAEHHYLGFCGLAGNSLKYVAMLDGQWVPFWPGVPLSSRLPDGPLDRVDGRTEIQPVEVHRE